MKRENSMLEKAKEANYHRLSELVEKIAKKNKKSFFFVYVDLFWNIARYHIGYTDYMKGDYINLSSKEKKDYLTSHNYYQLLQYLNDPDYASIFSDKIVFNKIFKKYIKRDFIDLRGSSQASFLNFIDKKDTVFAKKHNSFGGDGIEKIVLSNVENKEKLFDQFIQSHQYLIEETIIQHAYLDQINPYAVNNMRIMTLLKDGVVHILAVVLRVNGNRSEVITCHDVFMFIDSDGHVVGNVVDDEMNCYQTHPETGFEFQSMELPYIKECIDLVTEAALEIPEIRYVGWDVGLTPNGPVIIEGNFYPSYGLFQYFLLKSDHVGYLKKISEILGEEMRNIKW